MGDILGDCSVSSLYITKPQDYADQADFYNLVVAGDYEKDCQSLLAALQSLEAEFGRDRAREIPKGPRTLDIDIELFGNEIIREPELTVPHERMTVRQFVLVPLLELEPNRADPCTGKPFLIICDALPDQGVKKAGKLYENRE